MRLITMQTALPKTELFQLDPVSHIYTLGARVLPGTTGLLKSAGLIDSTWFNDASRIRGTAVHRACHYRAEGDLNWDKLDKSLHGYVRAYEDAIDALDFMPLEMEKSIYHETMLYGSTFDQFGTIKGKATMIELKSGTAPDWAGLQLAGQCMAYLPRSFYGIKRICLELHADGKYKAIPCDDVDDFDVFIGCVNLYHWKQKNQKQEIK